MAFLSQAGFGGSRVAVSLHALHLTANQFAIGVVIALYSLCPMLFAILIGKLADRVSPRRLSVNFGALIMTGALLIPVVVPGLPALCIAAFILGLSHQVFSLPIEALIGGIGGVEKRARNYAVITMEVAADFLGPMMAGFSIDHIGQLEVYLVLAVFTFAPVVMTTRPEVPRRRACR